MDSIDAPTSPLLRVPRRTPRACKQCRQAKIRCSGARPCDRCTRRHQSCVFPSHEQHVSIPERYLLDLQRRAQASSSASQPVPSHQPTAAPPLTPPHFAAPLSTAPQAAALHSAPSHLPSQSSAAHPGASNHVAPPPQQSPAHSISASASRSDSPSSILPHNPLVARNLPYIRDTKGRPRYLGPTSTWSFCRRALMLLEAQAPSPDGLSAPLNLDGTAFRLRWQPKPTLEPSDLKNLPPMDYAFYLYNTVKFHLGELFSIIDETYFLAQFERFHKAPWETAQTHTLWFAEYLLILAYGKAFLAPSNHSAAAPPGSEFAARAMALLPDPAQLHDEGMFAIEFLALVALYFQSIDMRTVAYQFIGQAVRLCYIEGIQRQVPDDVVSPGFANRCNTAWWTVYVLEHELTALMGGPPSIPEDDITTELPFEKSASLPAKALTLRIRLSRLIASMCNTVYGVEKGMGDTFVRTTTTVLHQLAEVSRELEDIKSSFDDVSRSELPHMLRNTMLSYHHCIVLATRPLVMWLLILSMPPATVEPQQLAHPIATLLQTSAESATANISMLRTLAEHDMLETFLPFQLEYAFSSAMLLSILGAVLPTFVANDNWHGAIDFVLDEMVKKKNPVARLRKSELNQLDALLNPLRGYGPVVPDASACGGDVAGQRHHDVESVQLADDDGLEMSWDGMGTAGNQLANPNQMLELAEQIGTGDLLSSFFFEC